MKSLKKIGAIVLALAVFAGIFSFDVTDVYAATEFPGFGPTLVCQTSSGGSVTVDAIKINPVIIAKTNDWNDSLVVFCYEFQNNDAGLFSTGIGCVPSYDGSWFVSVDDCYANANEVISDFGECSKSELDMMMKFRTIGWLSNVDMNNGEEEYIDRDTYKSCLPARSLLVEKNNNPTDLIELKAHEMSAKDSVNQKMLADAYAGIDGKKAMVVCEYSAYPKRDLTVTEDGSKVSLIWSNVPAKEGDVIFAVGYNQTDGAYYMKSVVDKEKKIKFDSFKLRVASNITLFKEQ